MPQAETLNPFDHRNTYQNLAADQQTVNGFTDSNSDVDLVQENLDLKRQVLLFQQQLEERDKTIKLLQSQMVNFKSIVFLTLKFLV